MKSVLLFLVLALSSLVAVGEERIKSFHSQIIVLRDGSLKVTETIKVKAEGKQIRRGIFRDFPQVHRMRWGFLEKRPFEVQSVTKNGVEEPYVVERLRRGSRVKIGREEAFLEQGIYTYVISYTTDRQLLTDVDGKDELYWNVSGNEWAFPIDQLTATVFLPDGVELTHVEAYTGKLKEKGDSYEARKSLNSAEFVVTRELSRGEGMSIVVQWPTGQLEAVAYEERNLFAENKLLTVGLGLFALGILSQLGLWFFVGKDPAPGVVIPRWEPPAGFSPAGVRFLKQMKFDHECFSAGILGLASKRVISIREKSKKFTIERDDQEVVLLPVEQHLFDGLLKGISKLKMTQKNHRRINKARKVLASELARKIERRYFTANLWAWLPCFILMTLGIFCMLKAGDQFMPSMFMLVFMSIWGAGLFSSLGSTVRQLRSGGKAGSVGGLIGLLFFGIPFLIMLGIFYTMAGPWAMGFFLLGSIIAYLFYDLIKRPTSEGRQVLDEIDGFKEYLSVAEEDRLNLENPPEKTPELFEKFLPYALALDVEQEWSQKFDEVLAAVGQSTGEGDQYRPSFYTGNTSGFNTATIGAGLGAAMTTALTQASSAPSSSGSGGGGYSGGGGGGGGGGGW